MHHREEYRYEIRAHHGTCLHFFRGYGYSNKFTEHMGKIARGLAENPQTLVRLSDKADVICKECPRNRHGACKEADRVAEYDKLTLQQCGFTVGEVLSFAEFQTKIHKSIIHPRKREAICGDCQWSSICH